MGTAGATTALVTAGAVGGAVFGFIASGGDLKAALTGALTGAAFAYVGSLAQAGSWGTFETALAHGAVGGAGSELGGGSFKDGFVGAFFAAAVNPLIKNSWPIEIKGALRTLAGGTASRLGGGKFANGATSAAMAFLFNEVLHQASGKNNKLNTAKAEKGSGWFRPDGHEYAAGRKGTFVFPGPKKGIGSFIDDYFPGGHTFATNHDAVVDYGTKILGLPDAVVNIPSMLPTYIYSFGQELINTPFTAVDVIFNTNTTPFKHSHPEGN